MDSKYTDEWFNNQLEKCLECPCCNENDFRGCYSCNHYKKDCADHNCGEGHILHNDKLKLCCADDCAMTMYMIGKED